MVFEADVFIESCLDKEGTEVAVSIFGSPDPSEDFDRLTAEGFKLDLTTGIYHRNP